MEENFYDEEYDYFDSTIADLKEQLKKEVKQEIKDKIAKLEKENEELKNVKENWNSIKEEYQRKERVLNYEKEKYKNKLKEEYFKTSFEEKLPFFFDTVYVADYSYQKKEKCNQCDENRKIDYISKQGTIIKGSCNCDKSKKIWNVSKGFCYTKVISLCNGDIRTETYVSRDSGRYDIELKKENIIEKFNKNNINKDYCFNYFKKEEEAQKYVDYLNTLEK